MKCQLSYPTAKIAAGDPWAPEYMINTMENWFGPAYHDPETGMTYWQFDSDVLVLAKMTMKRDYQMLIDLFNLCAEDDDILIV
jgi:hypothetical protein